MKRLEYYILKIFQNFMLTGKTGVRYIELEDNLFSVVKRDPNSHDLYIITECILNDRVMSLFSFEYIHDCMYRIKWNEKFFYLTGQSDELPSSMYTKELELIRNSESPLTNYIKTL